MATGTPAHCAGTSGNRTGQRQLVERDAVDLGLHRGVEPADHLVHPDHEHDVDELLVVEVGLEVLPARLGDGCISVEARE